MSSIYKRNPNFVLGFHGCDESVGEDVLAGKSTLKASENEYDWLGPGVYFWEGNPDRAAQFAKDAIQNSKTTQGIIKKPFVIGAIIDLGTCCNLHDQSSLDELIKAHLFLEIINSAADVPMPENKIGPDKLLRHLDCAVITMMHTLRKRVNATSYDTVRAAFHEGGELYPGSGFTKKSHVQIAVRDESKILGYFRPRWKGPT